MTSCTTELNSGRFRAGDKRTAICHKWLSSCLPASWESRAALWCNIIQLALDPKDVPSFLSLYVFASLSLSLSLSLCFFHSSHHQEQWLRTLKLITSRADFPPPGSSTSNLTFHGYVQQYNYSSAPADRPFVWSGRRVGQNGPCCESWKDRDELSRDGVPIAPVEP